MDKVNQRRIRSTTETVIATIQGPAVLGCAIEASAAIHLPTMVVKKKMKNVYFPYCNIYLIWYNVYVR